MFKISTLRRLALTAVVAGAAVATTTSAQATGVTVDDLIGPQKPAARKATGFNDPAPRKTTARRMTPGQFFAGDWTYRTGSGTVITIRFKANGHFYLVTSARPGVVQAGFWRFTRGKLIFRLVGTCRSKQEGGCRRLQRQRTLHLPIRFINKDRIAADGGVLVRKV